MVTLKELRTMYGEEEGEYFARIENLMLVLVRKNGGIKIEKYFHEKPSPTINIKYEGFW